MTSFAARPASLRDSVGRLIAGAPFQRTILALIIVNAVILGLETSTTVMAAAGPALMALDGAILIVFVLELALRIYVHRGRFFRDPWSLFDLTVVGVALAPAAGPLAVLRSLRVLRVLRTISAVPRMRRVVSSLLAAIPGLGAIVALLALIFYVAGVIATKLFGAAFPEWFGTLPASVYTLFQIMTLESWSMGIVRPVLAEYPYAWIFFIPFIAVATFTMLNLFIAVVVNAMQSEAAESAAAAASEAEDHILGEIRALRRELAELRQDMAKERVRP